MIRIDLLSRPQACSQAHHAVAHVPIQREVGGKPNQAVRLNKPCDLEPRGAHLDAQRFCCLGSRDSAPIVVAQHDKRAPRQRRAKHGFAGRVEVVSVHQSEHGSDPKALDRRCDYAPNFHDLAILWNDFWIGRIGRFELHAAMF